MRLCDHVRANIQLYRSAIHLMYRCFIRFHWCIRMLYPDVSHQCIAIQMYTFAPTWSHRAISIHPVDTSYTYVSVVLSHLYISPIALRVALRSSRDATCPKITLHINDGLRFTQIYVNLLLDCSSSLISHHFYRAIISRANYIYIKFRWNFCELLRSLPQISSQNSTRFSHHCDSILPNLVRASRAFDAADVSALHCAVFWRSA